MSSESIIDQDSPLWLRILLKVPAPNPENLPDRVQGYFWIAVMPVVIFSLGCVDLLLITCIPSPFNAIVFFSLNSFIVIMFIRILMERTWHLKKAILNQGHFEWDIDRSLNEYLDNKRMTSAPSKLAAHQEARSAEREAEKTSQKET